MPQGTGGFLDDCASASTLLGLPLTPTQQAAMPYSQLAGALSSMREKAQLLEWNALAESRTISDRSVACIRTRWHLESYLIAGWEPQLTKAYAAFRTAQCGLRTEPPTSNDTSCRLCHLDEESQQHLIFLCPPLTEHNSARH